MRSGRTQKQIVVRDPVVAELILPRFLAPGDEAQGTLNIDNVEGPAGAYTVTVGGSGAARIAAQPRRFQLARSQRQTALIPISGGPLGVGEITLRLEGPQGFTPVERSYDIQSRAPFLPITITSIAAAGGRRVMARASGCAGALPAVGAGADLVLQSGRHRSGADPGCSSIAIRTAARNSSPRWRCRCSTTTRWRPRRTARGSAHHAARAGGGDAIARSPGTGRRVRPLARRRRLRHAVARRLRHRLPAARAARRATRCRVSRCSRPTARCAASRGSTISARCATSSRSIAGRARTTPTELLRSRSAAYALYVLAKAGEADIGQLRYFHDARLRNEPSPLARAQIGAALAHMGDRARSRNAFHMAEQALGYRNVGDWYQTPLRDLAGVLALAAEAGETETGRSPAPAARTRCAGRRRSDDAGAGATAAGGQRAAASAPGPVNVSLNGQQMAERRVIADAQRLAAGLVFRNNARGPVWRTLSLSGAPREAPPAMPAGYTIDKRVFRMDGTVADLERVRQGDRVVVVISGQPDGARNYPTVLVDLLPAGLEIETLLASGGWRGGAQLRRHAAQRAVRVGGRRSPLRASAGIARRPLRRRRPICASSFRYAYIARAVSPGPLHDAGGASGGHVPPGRDGAHEHRHDPHRAAGERVIKEAPPPLEEEGQGAGATRRPLKRSAMSDANR